jgi:hypothetical protein
VFNTRWTNVGIPGFGHCRSPILPNGIRGLSDNDAQGRFVAAAHVWSFAEKLSLKVLRYHGIRPTEKCR